MAKGGGIGGGGVLLWSNWLWLVSQNYKATKRPLSVSSPLRSSFISVADRIDKQDLKTITWVSWSWIAHRNWSIMNNRCLGVFLIILTAKLLHLKYHSSHQHVLFSTSMFSESSQRSLGEKKKQTTTLLPQRSISAANRLGRGRNCTDCDPMLFIVQKCHFPFLVITEP